MFNEGSFVMRYFRRTLDEEDIQKVEAFVAQHTVDPEFETHKVFPKGTEIMVIAGCLGCLKRDRRQCIRLVQTLCTGEAELEACPLHQ